MSKLPKTNRRIEREKFLEQLDRYAFVPIPPILSIPMASKIQLPQDVTIECFCRPSRVNKEYGLLFSGPHAAAGFPHHGYALGFCNGELRPWFQVAFREGKVDIASNDVLPSERFFHLAGTYDGRHIRLYVNATLAAEKEVHGSVDHSDNKYWATAVDVEVAMGYIRYWVLCRTQQQIHELMETLTPDLGGRSIENLPVDDDLVSIPPECLPIGCGMWYANLPAVQITQSLSRRRDLAHRIVVAAGLPSTSDDIRKATETLLDCCQRLRKLVEENQSEPAFLQFFKENPHAAFLIELDYEQAWREVPLQGYGKIDFVFRKTSSRYLVVEIEGPNKQIFRGDGDFGQPFNHAVEQVEKWQRGVEKHASTLVNEYGMTAIEKPSGMVIIGRSAQFEGDPKLFESWNHRNGTTPIQLLTWDDILLRGQKLAERLSNPMLPLSDWA